jgi:hypothetical protein
VLVEIFCFAKMLVKLKILPTNFAKFLYDTESWSVMSVCKKIENYRRSWSVDGR